MATLRNPLAWKYPRLKSEWSALSRAKWAAMLDEQIRLPSAVTATFCACCAADLTGPVYRLSWRGVQRWPFACSECAAEWVLHGGRIDLAWHLGNHDCGTLAP